MLVQHEIVCATQPEPQPDVSVSVNESVWYVLQTGSVYPYMNWQILAHYTTLDTEAPPNRRCSFCDSQVLSAC